MPQYPVSGGSPRGGGDYGLAVRAPDYGGPQSGSAHDDGRGGTGYPLAVVRNQRDRERER